MPNAASLTPDTSRLRVLVYGPSGTGKTRGIATFPGPTYVFDADLGIMTLAGFDIEYDQFADLDPRHPSAWRAIEKKLDEIAASCKYRTVAFDSITTMSELLMNEVQRINGTLGKQPTLPEWGLQIDKMSAFMARIQALPCNVVVVGHEQIVQDDLTGEIHILPLITGKKLPGRLPLWFDEVYHTTVETDKKTGVTRYLVQTRADRKISAKTRLQGLDLFEPWDYQHIIAKDRAARGLA